MLLQFYHHPLLLHQGWEQKWAQMASSGQLSSAAFPLFGHSVLQSESLWTEKKNVSDPDNGLFQRYIVNRLRAWGSNAKSWGAMRDVASQKGNTWKMLNFGVVFSGCISIKWSFNFIKTILLQQCQKRHRYHFIRLQLHRGFKCFTNTNTS